MEASADMWYFADGVLKYTNDGASYINSKGETIWIQSYEMNSPIVSVNGEFAVVADRQGTGIYICSVDGCQGQTEAPASHSSGIGFCPWGRGCPPGGLQCQLYLFLQKRRSQPGSVYQVGSVRRRLPGGSEPVASRHPGDYLVYVPGAGNAEKQDCVLQLRPWQG